MFSEPNLLPIFLCPQVFEKDTERKDKFSKTLHETKAQMTHPEKWDAG